MGVLDRDRTVKLRGYSADVRIELDIEGRVLSPTHSAPDYLIFREPQTLALSRGRLIVTVDGIAHRSNVEIMRHSSPATRIPIRLTSTANA